VGLVDSSSTYPPSCRGGGWETPLFAVDSNPHTIVDASKCGTISGFETSFGGGGGQVSTRGLPLLVAEE
jgi:hypothetical protein